MTLENLKMAATLDLDTCKLCLLLLLSFLTFKHTFNLSGCKVICL